MSSTIEQQLLAALQELQQTVKTLAPEQTKPKLIPLFDRIDHLTSQLPPETDPILLHFLQKRSYEKARVCLEKLRP